MKTSNIALTIIALNLIMTGFNVNAKNKEFSAIDPNLKLIKKINNDGSYPGDTSTEFEIYNLKDNYRIIEDKAKIEFRIYTNKHLNYYAYIRKDNFIYGDASGFANNSLVDVYFFANDVNSGEYELIVEAYNNNQASSKKEFNITLG
ncbi:TPA: hypothetical protein PXP51_002170 [Yersinia enterocolitica]|nr:hypothetical protein [Yersinia enterocolitica]